MYTYLIQNDEGIARHEANIELKAKGTCKGGVKERPFFQKVLHCNILLYVLREMMDLGNGGLDHVIGFIELYIKELPQEVVHRLKKFSTHINAKSCQSTYVMHDMNGISLLIVKSGRINLGKI